jgi:hypothetical protein
MKTPCQHNHVALGPYAKAPGRAFSLMELLVVICIIATTLALAMPSIMKTREAALKTLCQQNLRAVGIGDFNYRASHREWMVTMDSYYYPSPAAGSNNLIRPDEPGIYKDLWPENIRWCPSLKYSSGYVADASAVTVVIPPPPVAAAPAAPAAKAAAAAAPAAPAAATAPPPYTHNLWGPVNWTRYATFGYARPALDQMGSVLYPANRIAMEPVYPNRRTWPTFVRMDYSGNARYTYLGRSYRLESTRPLASDLIVTLNSNAHVTAHNGMYGKINGPWPGNPQGASAVWNDGSVKWYAFPGKEQCYSNYRDVATGYSASPIPGPVPDEAFVQETVNGPFYYFPARRGPG